MYGQHFYGLIIVLKTRMFDRSPAIRDHLAAPVHNQICIAGAVQGLAEGIHFAQTVGLDVAAVIDIISRGAAHWPHSAADGRGR